MCQRFFDASTNAAPDRAERDTAITAGSMVAGALTEGVGTLADGVGAGISAFSVLTNDRIYPICRGSVYLINAMNIHSTNPPHPTEYERSVLTLDREYADLLFRLLGISDYMTNVLTENSGAFYRLDSHTAELVDDEYKVLHSIDPTDNHGKTLFVKSVANILLLIMGRGTNSEKTSSTISVVLDYINRHIKEMLTVDSISQATNISKYHLCRTFRKQSGVTIMNYIREQRIAIAKDMLLKTNESITKIAASSGFVDSSYFSMVFRLSEGMTPREYRRKYIK